VAVSDTDKSKTRPDKSELVNQAMDRFGIPSWEAWDMTVAELAKKLES
jgi:hypothetical protein